MHFKNHFPYVIDVFEVRLYWTLGWVSLIFHCIDEYLYQSPVLQTAVQNCNMLKILTHLLVYRTVNSIACGSICFR